MAPTACARCGGLIPIGARFCPFCGAPAGGPAATGPTSVPSAPGHYAVSGPLPTQGFTAPPVPPNFYGWAAPPSPNAGTRRADWFALTQLLYAAALLLVIGAVSAFTLGFEGSLLAVRMTSAGDAVSFTPAFYVVVSVSAILGVVDVLLLRSAFRTLAPFDARFSTPATLALLYLIGFLLVLVALIPLLAGVSSLASCMIGPTNNTVSGNCSGIGLILVGGLVALVAGIVALIGFIGILIGIWRFGTRYQSGLFKAGAILLLIPFLSVLGAIFILAEAYSTRSRLGVGGSGGPRPY
jgi:hypothetical protein